MSGSSRAWDLPEIVFDLPGLCFISFIPIYRPLSVPHILCSMVAGLAAHNGCLLSAAWASYLGIFIVR
jgi:hypothetical protein